MPNLKDIDVADIPLLGDDYLAEIIRAAIFHGYAVHDYRVADYCRKLLESGIKEQNRRRAAARQVDAVRKLGDELMGGMK